MKKFLLALATLAMISSSANAMYVIGDPAGAWGPSKGVKMTEKNGAWEWTGTIESDKYFAFAAKLMDDDSDWQTFNSTYRLAPEVENTQANPGEYNLVHKDASFMGCGAECKYIITKDGDNYKLTVENLGEIPVTPEEPGDVKYYAVGNFQDWNPEAATEFTLTDGVFTLVAQNAAAIKISTAKGDWDSFNAATIGPKDAEFNYENGPFEIQKCADYQFTFDYPATWTITIDPVKKTMEFTTKDPKPTSVSIYLRGSMNDWNAVDAWKFETTDNILFTLSQVSISADETFKVADANWGSINYGTGTKVEPNTTVTLVTTDDNIQLTESVKNATVEFNLSDKTLKVSTSTGINSIGSADQNAIYFNLQGAKVEKDTKGVLIRVSAGKAEKVIVK